jgi:hypothetical protein
MDYQKTLSIDYMFSPNSFGLTENSLIFIRGALESIKRFFDINHAGEVSPETTAINVEFQITNTLNV